MTKIIAAKLGEENERGVNRVPHLVPHLMQDDTFRVKKKRVETKASVLIQSEPIMHLDAGANRAQQKRRQMRVIGGLRFSLALGAARLGTADRRYA